MGNIGTEKRTVRIRRPQPLVLPKSDPAPVQKPAPQPTPKEPVPVP